MNKVLFVKEVSLEGGFQNVGRFLSLEDKIKFIEIVLKSRIKKIQLGSFVNPGKVPQISDYRCLIKQTLVKILGNSPMGEFLQFIRRWRN